MSGYSRRSTRQRRRIRTDQAQDASRARRQRDADLAASLSWRQGLSDTGDLTGRGRPCARGAVTGAGTFLGGILHTLPFLIPQYRPAMLLALAVIAFELLALAWIRRRFFGTSFLASLVTVTLGGAIIAITSAALGAVS